MMDELSPVKDAIRDGHLELARNLLRVLIEDHPDNSDVWYWASQAAVNDNQRKAFLEKAVALDPLHHRAANALVADDIDNDFIPHPDFTPPQVAVKAQASIVYANFGRRAIATIIDIGIIGVAVTPFAMVIFGSYLTTATVNMNLLLENPRLYALLLVFTTLIQGAYHGYFLSQKAGQTLGKRWMKIRVVKVDGTDITLWEAILRNVVGYQLSNLIPGVGFLWMLTDKHRRTWHDMVAETIVVDAI